MISILYIYISKSRYSDKYRSATILMVIMIIVNSYSPNSFGLCPDVTIIAITAPSLQGIIIFSTSISPSPNVPSLQGDYLQHLSLFLQMLYLRARLSRRRSWVIVVGAGHFHPAVLVPRVGPVSGGGRVMLGMGTG